MSDMHLGHLIVKRPQHASNALQLTLTLGIIYGLVCILGAKPLIHFFHLNQAQVIRDAIYYLEITCGLVLFSFLNQTYTGLFTAIGNSRPVFLATTTGLVVNIIRASGSDFWNRTISGSSSDRCSNCYGNRADDRYSYVFYICDEGYRTFSICRYLKSWIPHLKGIVRIGFPTSVQSMLFTGISMIIARLVAGYGDAAVAVQKVRSQYKNQFRG